MKNSRGSCLFYNVCSSGHVYFVKLLIENGADVNWGIGNNCTPLCAASHQNRLNLFKINFDDDQYIFRLEEAMAHNQLDVAKLLLEHEKKSAPHRRYFDVMDTSNIQKCYLPIEAAILNEHVDIVRLLIDYGAECNFTNDSGFSSMHFSVYQNNLEIIQLLLGKGVNIDVVDKNGASPLHYASLTGNFCVVQFLVERGANLNLADEKGFTPIHNACFGGKVELVQFIMDRSIDIYSANHYGYPTSQHAVIKNRIDVVNFLIKNGADINAVAENGNTSLSLAGSSFYFPLHKILLTNGADENAGLVERQKYLLLKLQQENVEEEKERNRKPE